MKLNELPPKQRGGLVAIDLEMFGLPTGRIHRPYGELALAAFATEKGTYVVDNIKDLKRAFANVRDNILAFHNATFDVPHLRRWVSLPDRNGKKIWDTVLIERILWNGYFDSFELKDCARRWLGVTLEKGERKEFYGERIPITKEMIEYNAKDAWATRELALVQMKEFESRPGLFKVWTNIDCPALFAVLQMKGFMINQKRWLEIAEEHRKDAEKIRDRLGFNPGSWQQITEVARGRGINLKNTREDELDKFKDDDIIRQVLEYKFHAKRMSAYGQGFLDRLCEADGRIYASYNITGAETGRMSSGMQQIPVRDSPMYRECFIADRGNALVIADYHAQEPKLLAQMSGDPALLEIFRNGEDVHLIVTRIVLKDDTIHKGDKRMVAGHLVDARNQVGKIINLASSYGLTDIGLSMHLGCPLDEAKGFMAAYFRKFVGVFAYINAQRALARREFKVSTLGGRECWVNPYGHKGENNAINSPIQGSAADCTKLALSKLYRYCLRTRKAFPVVGIVHDEIILEVPIREVKVWSKALEDCMTEAIRELAPDVCHSHAVDIAVGKSWAAKH